MRIRQSRGTIYSTSAQQDTGRCEFNRRASSVIKLIDVGIDCGDQFPYLARNYLSLARLKRDVI